MNYSAALPSYKQQLVTPANRCANAVAAMCDKCTELDKKITHFQKLIKGVLDPQTVEGLNKLIKERQAQKAALHLEQKQAGRFFP